ncbi:hypothetical protein [Janthinobacterium sp. 1_2014MBL_MicDiv]|uniref:hypothetical protein n=1 Tax=Janthinobacterium sp. 1_2014MBL_MicDiv TaxID=1644131 RepID=UPI0008F4CDF8|nr:hypothetical protein [Janthinobacterium sp. 1_2014MBL_MicDiv]APA68491.1 hypothetical protein YQ44_12440 [Janthinobacterium sp. 1_2014MBL_MicDiv]
MRNYLYIWHDPDQQMLVASGIEFGDFLPTLGEAGGVLLLKGDAAAAQYDAPSGLQHVSQMQLAALAREDMASWGSHAWADYQDAALPPLGDMDVAEAVFFAHRGRALRRPRIPGLGNRFLAYAHDDGWYLKLFYSAWDDVAQLLAGIVPAALGTLDMQGLQQGDAGYWLRQGVVQAEVRTHDIDSVLNRRL